MAKHPVIRAPSAAPPSVSAEPAGLIRRLAALLYDALLLGALLFLFTLALLVARGGRAIPPGTAWYDASLVLVVVLFFCGFWTHGGQTLGMRAWQIRLVSSAGGTVTLPAALLRVGAAVLAALPLGLGFLASLWDPQRRCWHDRWSRTRVVRRHRLSAPERAQ